MTLHVWILIWLTKWKRGPRKKGSLWCHSECKVPQHRYRSLEAGCRKHQLCLMTTASQKPRLGPKGSYSTWQNHWDLLHDQMNGQCAATALLWQRSHGLGWSTWTGSLGSTLNGLRGCVDRSWRQCGLFPSSRVIKPMHRAWLVLKVVSALPPGSEIEFSLFLIRLKCFLCATSRRGWMSEVLVISPKSSTKHLYVMQYHKMQK